MLAAGRAPSCRGADRATRTSSSSSCADADAILTCFAQVTGRVVAAGQRLRVIGRYGIGTDNIAVDEATERGIPVTNVPATAPTRSPSTCSR